MKAISFAVLASALIFGGGTITALPSDVLLQLVSALALALFVLRSSGSGLRYMSIIIALLLVMAAYQLTPLGMDPQKRLPALLASHVGLASGIGLGGISVVPYQTLAGMISLLPAVVMFVAVTELTSDDRRSLVSLFLALGAFGIVVALLQVAQGPNSALRFHAVTNPTEAVGFFANRNHLASELAAMLVLGAYWVVTALGGSRRELRFGTSRESLALVAAGFLLLAVIVTLALTRSRAGLLMAMAALLGVIPLISRSRGFKSKLDAFGGLVASRVVVAAIALGVVLSLQFTLGAIMSRFDVDALRDQRIAFAATTLEAIAGALPFGTGIGSFVDVYAVAEKSQDLFAGYGNRAHDDWLEFVLENGVVGMALAAIFFGWFVVFGIRAWLRSGEGEDRDLPRAATLVILLLLAHSVIDYPLRTSALQVLFAMCCAFLLLPKQGPSRPVSARVDGERPEGGTGQERMPVVAPEPVAWGTDIQWPEEWTSRPSNPAKRDG